MGDPLYVLEKNSAPRLFCKPPAKQPLTLLKGRVLAFSAELLPSTFTHKLFPPPTRNYSQSPKGHPVSVLLIVVLTEAKPTFLAGSALNHALLPTKSTHSVRDPEPVTDSQEAFLQLYLSLFNPELPPCTVCLFF